MFKEPALTDIRALTVQQASPLVRETEVYIQVTYDLQSKLNLKQMIIIDSNSTHLYIFLEHMSSGKFDKKVLLVVVACCVLFLGKYDGNLQKYNFHLIFTHL